MEKTQIYLCVTLPTLIQIITLHKSIDFDFEHVYFEASFLKKGVTVENDCCIFSIQSIFNFYTFSMGHI